MSQPADHEVREAVAAEYRKAHGLDLTGEERAAWIRAKAEGISDLAGIYADGGFDLQDFLADRHGEDDQP